ncbi:substrate-binding domain-containing protein [Treponema brennaborense]|uniref:Transcriptional regulator, LacI family n=1 Tax=Treponema brennaborense (strain DSM 12168 / CIP 105900 / DD5/3) TaxID=906968 RepID=F4LME9_TREBD|nr:substrate-binding domain-containing protein [Treponema brennaborense]AEE15711.1 transcriptional regulator, LacI family [Treponema brennaborense DSM 12168]
MHTIHEVAKLAGVSTATVSHVCNNTRYVSDDLRRKVLDAMAALQYKPNVIARGLRGGSLKSIGLVVPDCTNTFFAEIARAVDRVCFSQGYNIILCNTDNNVQQQSFYIDMLISKQVDGIIFISADETDADIRKCLDFSIPVVVADRDVTDDSVDNIIVDNELGAYQAASHLVSCGFSRIACITGPENIPSSRRRLHGFEKALREASVPLPESYVFTGNFHYSGGRDAFGYFSSLPCKPDAVFACNDMMALGFIHTALSSGLRIPSDVSIIGFDNTELSTVMSPKLSTVAQPIEEIAEIALRLLLGKIEKTEKRIRKVVLEPRLILRETCGKSVHSASE